MGFLLSGPGIAGIAIAFALAFGGVQTWRLHSCQADSASLRASVTVMGAQISEQNAAVKKLAADGAAKAKEAAQALAKAETRAKVWDAQATRLAAALKARKPDGPKDCGAAWAEIRSIK